MASATELCNWIISTQEYHKRCFEWAQENCATDLESRQWVAYNGVVNQYDGHQPIDFSNLNDQSVDQLQVLQTRMKNLMNLVHEKHFENLKYGKIASGECPYCKTWLSNDASDERMAPSRLHEFIRDDIELGFTFWTDDYDGFYYDGGRCPYPECEAKIGIEYEKYSDFNLDSTVDDIHTRFDSR